MILFLNETRKKVMKALLRISVLTLVATIALAQTDSKPVASGKRSPRPASAKEVQELRDALAAQQQQMEAQRQQMEQLKSQLQQFLDSAQQANAGAQKGQNSADEAQRTAADAQRSAAEAQRLADQASSSAAQANSALSVVNTKTQEQDKRLSALQDILGRLRFSGDVRIRGENFTQSGIPDRNRARIRARFGFDSKLNEDFTAGIFLATGALGDPTTTNETFNNFFDRKTIALDRGFITYNPVAHNWLSLTGGKFAYLWQRTSVTGDPDLNPEGFDQKFSFNFSGPVKNLTVQAIQLLYSENAGAAGVSAVAAQDSYALGGQLSAKMQFGPWTVTPSYLGLKWNRPDALLQASAFAVGATTTGFQPAGTPLPAPITGIPVPGEGQGCAKGTAGLPAFAPCAFAPNGMTNATYLDPKGIPHFYSGFNYADVILNNQIKTGMERLPLNLVLEFEENLDAKAHPLDSKGKVISSIGSQNKEYGADFSLGQTKNKNDVQFGYAWQRQEQDADIASFGESDQRTPTNLIQNRVYALWKLRSNTLAGATWWHGKVLNTNLENNAALVQKTISKPGLGEPYLNRFQFDLIYTF
jgi:Putative porin